MSISDVPLGFQQGTLRVDGTNSDWIKPIEDCIYDYITDKWSVQTRLITDTQTDPFKWRKENINYDGHGTQHIWIERKETNRVQEAEGQFWNCDCRFQVMVMVQQAQNSQTKAGKKVDIILREINRLLMQYSSHWIAGIYDFNNFTEVPVIWLPDDDKNPFQGFHVAAFIGHAYYYYVSDFSNESIPYNYATVSAGQLTYADSSQII